MNNSVMFLASKMYFGFTLWQIVIFVIAFIGALYWFIIRRILNGGFDTKPTSSSGKNKPKPAVKSKQPTSVGKQPASKNSPNKPETKKQSLGIPKKKNSTNPATKQNKSMPTVKHKVVKAEDLSSNSEEEIDLLNMDEDDLLIDSDDSFDLFGDLDDTLLEDDTISVPPVMVTPSVTVTSIKDEEDEQDVSDLLDSFHTETESREHSFVTSGDSVEEKINDESVSIDTDVSEKVDTISEIKEEVAEISEIKEEVVQIHDDERKDVTVTSSIMDKSKTSSVALITASDKFYSNFESTVSMYEELKDYVENNVSELNCNDDCSIQYCNNNKRKATIKSNGEILLPTYKIFVNGIECHWSESFEIDVKKGDIVEIDTGTRIIAPPGYEVVVSSVSDLSTVNKIKPIQDEIVIKLIDNHLFICAEAFAIGNGYLSRYKNYLIAKVRKSA